MASSTLNNDTQNGATNGAKDGQKPAQLPTRIHPDFKGQLDADFLSYFNDYCAPRPSTHDIKIEDIRKFPQLYSNPWFQDFTYEPFVHDIDVKSDDGHIFKVRCYEPDVRSSPYGSGPYPVYINFHGGGFTLGSLMADAEICKLVRDRLGIKVMDVDYRLCPENTMYRGHDDAWAAVRWVHEHGKETNTLPNSISIGGISAGGHISAVVQQLARDADLPLKLAFIAVPLVTSHLELKQASDSIFPSMVEKALAPNLNWARLAFFRDHCTPQTQEAKDEVAKRPDFYKNPLNGNLQNLCDTFVATASEDPIRDEGRILCRRFDKSRCASWCSPLFGGPSSFYAHVAA